MNDASQILKTGVFGADHVLYILGGVVLVQVRCFQRRNDCVLSAGQFRTEGRCRNRYICNYPGSAPVSPVAREVATYL